MRETIRSLFIVAPDANAATLKKLRGIGVATDTKITAVQNISDLAMPPPAFSTLLIPDYLIDQGYQTTGWHQVFEVTQNLHTTPSRVHNVISSKESTSNGPDCIQIVNQLIRHLFDKTHALRWYSIQNSILFQARQMAPQLTKWMADHQIKMTSKFSFLIKSLVTLEQITSASAMHQGDRSLGVMLDTKHLEINIKIPCPNPLSIDRLQTAFSGVDATLLMFTKFNDELAVKVQIPLGLSNEQSIVIFITNQQNDSVGAQPEKDAS